MPPWQRSQAQITGQQRAAQGAREAVAAKREGRVYEPRQPLTGEAHTERKHELASWARKVRSAQRTGGKGPALPEVDRSPVVPARPKIAPGWPAQPLIEQPTTTRRSAL